MDYAEDKVSYKLNEIDFTAHIVYSPKAVGNIIIPKSIKYKDHDYIVTKICSNSFEKNRNIKSIRFESGSKLHIIERNAFYFSEIVYLEIPSDVEILEEGWGFQTPKLTEIKLSPENRNFMLIDNKLLLSKSDAKSDNYDIANFAVKSLDAITVPSYVTRIGNCCFSNCSFIQSINFQPNSQLRTIGKLSFFDSSISEISIPPLVKRIEYGAFSKCTDLSKIFFSEGSELEIIEKAAFHSSELKEIIIPSNVKTIDEETFRFCSLTSFNFEKNSKIKTIKKNAFSDTHINTLNLPSTIEQIEDGWCNANICINSIHLSPQNNNFKLINNGTILLSKSNQNVDFDTILYASRSICEISIPFYIRYISNNAFQNCKHLKSVEFEPNSTLYSIGVDSFSNSNIKTIVIPSSVEIIYEAAFLQCKNLTSVKFENPSKLRIIKQYAFFNTGISEISIPESICQIERCAFELCGSLSSVIFSEKSLLSEISEELFHNTILVEIKIPSSVKIIRKRAFANCSLKSIIFPENSELRIIEEEALGNINSLSFPSKIEELKDGWNKPLNSLTSFTIHPEIKFIKSLNNELILGKSNPNIDAFDTILFAIRNIKSVQIPSEIKIISKYAFSGCTSLVSVDFPKDSKLEIIDDSAFSADANILSFNIPSTVKKIGKFALLSFCPPSFTFPSNPDFHAIETYSLAYATITSITIPSSVKKIDNYAFYSAWIKNVFFLPDSQLITIGRFAFFRNRFEEISFPATLKYIDENAFSECESLRKINFPSNSQLLSIGQKAFMSSKIDSFHVPQSVTFIDFCALNTKSIEFDENSKLTYLGGFNLNSSTLTHFTFPRNLNYIGYCFFYQCFEIKSVEFLSDFIEMDDFAMNSIQLFLVSFPNAKEISFNFRFQNLPNLTIFVNANARIKKSDCA